MGLVVRVWAAEVTVLVPLALVTVVVPSSVILPVKATLVRVTRLLRPVRLMPLDFALVMDRVRPPVLLLVLSVPAL